MRRYGWILIAVGLTIAGVVGLNFVAYCLADPQRNDPLTGFLSMAGVWAGLMTAGIGAVFVARTRGVPTPPI
jgi:predicted Kef-type K+ transport protein